MYSSKQPSFSHNFLFIVLHHRICHLVERYCINIFFHAQEKRRPHKNGDKSVSVVRFIACYTTVDVVNKKVRLAVFHQFSLVCSDDISKIEMLTMFNNVRALYVNNF